MTFTVYAWMPRNDSAFSCAAKCRCAKEALDVVFQIVYKGTIDHMYQSPNIFQMCMFETRVDVRGLRVAAIVGHFQQD